MKIHPGFYYKKVTNNNDDCVYASCLLKANADMLLGIINFTCYLYSLQFDEGQNKYCMWVNIAL